MDGDFSAKAKAMVKKELEEMWETEQYKKVPPIIKKMAS